MIAADGQLVDSLRALLRLLESLIPGMVGSILVLDIEKQLLNTGAAPSLAAKSINSIDGMAFRPCPGLHDKAGWLKRPVRVKEIATNPRWKDPRRMALQHGFKVCRAIPILDSQQRWLGTIALHFRQRPLQEKEHLALIQVATDIAGIAISRGRDKALFRARESKLKAAQRLAKIGYWERDLANGRIFSSQQSSQIFGLAPGHPSSQAELRKVIYQDDRPFQQQALREVLEKGKPYDVEYRIVRPDGKLRFVHAWDEIVRDQAGRPIRLFGTVQDITERKQAEEALRTSEEKLRQVQQELARASRWTTVGELTASIAHEINQPLASVVANAQASLKWLTRSKLNIPEAQRSIRRIGRDGKRAGEVIARVRALLKNSKPVRTPLDINQLVRTTVSLVRSELRRNKVTLRLDLAPELPRVFGDPIQLQQVIMNLVLNAMDGLKKVTKRRRRLRVSTAMPKLPVLRLEISDTGIGMRPDLTKHLFEPFFTTKPNGMGLGLPISRSIIKAHGGHLWAIRNRGPGMTFRFTLPIQTETAHESGS